MVLYVLCVSEVLFVLLYLNVQLGSKRARHVSLTFESFIKPTSVTLPESSLGHNVSDSGH